MQVLMQKNANLLEIFLVHLSKRIKKDLHISKKYCNFAPDMNKYSPEIATLRMDIEREVKRKIRTPYDFEFLAGVIWERLHENISPTTLKRLWGYIDGADTTRRTTLCLLAQFLGFADWETYVASLATRTDIESAAFEGEGIQIDDLQQGDRVEVTWLPNRRCVFRYEGDAHFAVIEAENAKLHVGDSFDAACFIIGKPMYLDNLKSQMSNDKLQMMNVSYVAGSKNGLNSVRKLP